MCRLYLPVLRCFANTLAVLSLSGGVLAATRQGPKPIAEFDFEIAGGRIYVPAIVSGHHLWAILDSGCDPTTIDIEVAKRWRLPRAEKITVYGTGAKGINGNYIDDGDITIGGISIPLEYSIPLEPLSSMEGRHVQAIVGYEFLNLNIVEVDYAKRHIRVFAPTSKATPKGEPVPMRIVGDMPHITARIMIEDHEYSVESLVDTGASGVDVTSQFLKKHPIKLNFPTLMTGNGLGGASYGKVFRATYVSIGSTILASPEITTTETKSVALGDSAGFEFLIGSELLKRFVVTFDYPHHKIYFAPTENAYRPFQANKTGFRFAAHGPALRTYQIFEVMPGSTADQAGVKVGDIIETVDGRPASDLSLNDLKEAFKSPTPKEWTLGLRRNGKPITVTVLSKSII